MRLRPNTGMASNIKSVVQKRRVKWGRTLAQSLLWRKVNFGAKGKVICLSSCCHYTDADTPSPPEWDKMQSLLAVQICHFHLQICKYANLQICKYSCMRVSKYGRVEVWRYASMQVCKYSSMPVCKYAIMQVFKYASIQVCKYAGRQVCKDASM